MRGTDQRGHGRRVGEGSFYGGVFLQLPPCWLLLVVATYSHSSFLLDCTSLPEASCIHVLSVDPCGPYPSLPQARGSGVLAVTIQKDGFLQSCLHFVKLPL